MVLGIIGIAIAFVVLLYLTFKNISTIILAPIAVVIVAIFNQLAIVTSITDTYMGGLANIVILLFPLILLGTILGRVYTETGASTSIANTFIKAFVDKAEGEKKIKIACAVIIIIACLFQFGGIDSFVVMFTTFPIIVTMFKRLDMPRKYIPGMLMCSVGVGACAGAPTIHNVLPMAILGTSSTAGAIPGIIGFLIIEIGSYIMISTMIIRAIRRGEHFEYGDMEQVPEFDSENSGKLPKFIIAILPLLLVFVLFTIIKLSIVIALSSGIILALLLMGKNIVINNSEVKYARAGKIISTVNSGAVMSTKAIIEISVIGGFAAVVAVTPAFTSLTNKLMGLPIHPLIIVMIAVFILVALTSSPPAGLSIILPIFATAFLANTGALGISVSADAIHRISTISCLTFETLPFNGMIVVALSMAKVKHKEGYLPMFLASVAFPIIAAVVATILFILFPALG